jgi:hypothetical protein
MATEIKFMRRMASCTCLDCKKSFSLEEELEFTARHGIHRKLQI